MNELRFSKKGPQTSRSKAVGYGEWLKRFEWGHDNTTFVSTMICPTELGREAWNFKPCTWRETTEKTGKRQREKKGRALKRCFRVQNWAEKFNFGCLVYLHKVIWLPENPFFAGPQISLLQSHMANAFFSMVRGGVGMFSLAVIVSHQDQ